jgi:hypothetical protein
MIFGDSARSVRCCSKNYYTWEWGWCQVIFYRQFAPVQARFSSFSSCPMNLCFNGMISQWRFIFDSSKMHIALPKPRESHPERSEGSRCRLPMRKTSIESITAIWYNLAKGIQGIFMICGLP